MNKTKIEWVKNPDGSQGYTWNPITGCLNHIDGLCKGGNFPCYAYKLANGRLRQRYLYNANTAKRPHNMDSPLWDRIVSDPFYPRFWEERIDEPVFKWHEWGSNRIVKHYASDKGIFVCDMSDLFGIGIPEEWTWRVMDTIKGCPQHRFYLLTKQPQNLIKFSPFPDNCWVGVTVTHREMAHSTFNHFQSIEASVKYLSFEPLLDIVSEYLYFPNLIKSVQWVIIGAQTKPYKPPEIEWVEEIVRACDKASVKVFLKDNLAPLMSKLELSQVIDGQGLPRVRGDYTLRQEIPE